MPAASHIPTAGPIRRRLMAAAVTALIMGAPWISAPATAQERATMVADTVAINGDDTLTAQGNVEVFYQGRELRASSLTYDRSTDRLAIEGPIVLTDATGDTIVLADQAAMDADLTEGVMTGARMVLDKQLQIAAAELRRVGGRYTQLSRSVASSCKVCAGSPTPLWEIRARRIVHDELAQQIYFSDAQFRVAGVPVFWLPRLRMPDPTLRRANGVLAPEFRTTSGLGTGLKLPYFITLGRSADLTVTPYLTTKSGRTVELRYRQAFTTGQIEITGAISRDEIMPDDTRGYLTANGTFALPQGFTLRFHGETVSDDGYLLDYGYPEEDRLESYVQIDRTRRNEYIAGRVLGVQSIREGESNSTIPSLIADFVFHRRFSGGPFGGEAGLRFSARSQTRTSDEAYDVNGDGVADGRDTARLSLRGDWRRNWVTDPGIVATLMAEGTADFYDIAQDSVYGGRETRLQGAVGAELRWPWVKSSDNGVSHLIEPVVQMVWAPGGRGDIPNEDSTLVEFDESNLFAMNRYPGSDAIERGRWITLGMSYTRYDPTGWSLSMAGGRVLRYRDLDQFSAASGLDGRRSDWLAAWQLTMSDGLVFTNRVLVDDKLNLTKAEMRLDASRDRYSISSGYVYLPADAEEDRADDLSELHLSASYDINPSWTTTASTRYDFDANRATRAGVGFEWRNECVEVDLSLSRRFTSSTSVKPDTSFSLSVQLVGFGSGAQGGPARTCTR